MSESSLKRAARVVRDAARGIRLLPKLEKLNEQLEYVDREVNRLNAAHRRTIWRAQRRSELATQTKASFSFQWEHMPTGRALPSDPAFMRGLEEHLCTITGVAKDWFAGKRIVDVGCGIGRYSYGFLQMNAEVTACDQSEVALGRTAELCAPFRDRLTLRRIDLLEWNDPGDFDLAFSFGVVHHTGNTYLATENVCRKVRPGGRLFLMIYGVPQTRLAIQEVNEYERIAETIRPLTFDERKQWLLARFGPDAAHGWFDAVSPRINDRLTFEEIQDLLEELGFGEIVRTVDARNHHVTAVKLRP
jgi:2-polyprenyl-3-methyl-5-hydroxy-6-metoxy-1,4-benzoquinol methylase